MLLDVLFSAEEVSAAVAKLKNRKAAGPDGLMAEHLKEGGESVVIWLMNILNAVVELEVVPGVLKRGVVVPVYKSGGKDPLKLDSYRGVTLTSMVGKVLEFLFLERCFLRKILTKQPTRSQCRVQMPFLLHKRLLHNM